VSRLMRDERKKTGSESCHAGATERLLEGLTKPRKYL